MFVSGTCTTVCFYDTEQQKSQFGDEIGWLIRVVFLGPFLGEFNFLPDIFFMLLAQATIRNSIMNEIIKFTS